MLRRYRFPIKGSFYYAAEIAYQQHCLPPGQTLFIHSEPDNRYDANALQIWTQPQAAGYLIGYVPRQLAKLWHPLFKSSAPQLELQLSKSQAKGKLLRLECEIELNLTWRQHLQFQLWCLWLRQQTAVKHWLAKWRHS